MSTEIPVFAGAVDCALVLGRSISHDDALNLVPESNWMGTSRNWWYQELVKTLCDLYAGFDELRYLTHIVAIVPSEAIATKIQAVKRLLATINENPQPFVDATPRHGATAEEVRENITQAKVNRDVDDDSKYAFSNFFSFLVSHVAALEEAQSNGKCLLYVQAQA